MKYGKNILISNTKLFFKKFVCFGMILYVPCLSCFEAFEYFRSIEAFEYFRWHNVAAFSRNSQRMSTRSFYALDSTFLMEHSIGADITIFASVIVENKSHHYICKCLRHLYSKQYKEKYKAKYKEKQRGT